MRGERECGVGWVGVGGGVWRGCLLIQVEVSSFQVILLVRV